MSGKDYNKKEIFLLPLEFVLLLFCQNWDEESSDEEEDSPIMEDPDMMEKAQEEAPTTGSKSKRQKRVSRE